MFNYDLIHDARLYFGSQFQTRLRCRRRRLRVLTQTRDTSSFILGVLTWTCGADGKLGSIMDRIIGAYFCGQPADGNLFRNLTRRTLHGSFYRF